MPRIEIAEVVQNTAGQVIPGSTVQVNDLLGNALRLYAGDTGGSTVGNPLTSDAAGDITAFIDAPDFDLAVSRSGYTSKTHKSRFSVPGVYNVKSYGAKGDGTTNDTTAVQAALTAGAGGVVFFPQGTFLVTTALTVSSDTVVHGAPGSTLKVGGAAHTAGSINGLTSSGTSRIVVEGLRIVGPEDGTMLTTPNVQGTGLMIMFDAVTDYVIRDCHISNFNTHGIYLGACTRGKVYGNTVQGGYSANGISCDGLCVDTVIANNTVKDVADCGIGTHNGAVGTIIAGNTITNTSFGRGIDVYGAPDTVVANNTLRQIGGNGSAGHGIYVYPGLGGTLPSRVMIVGNKVYAPDDSGIVLDGSTAWNDATVVGNQVLGATGTSGIYVTQAVSRVLIQGNQAHNNTGPGIYLEHISALIPTKVAVLGNHATANGTVGVKATASVTDVQYDGNAFVGNTVQETDIPVPSIASAGAMGVLPRGEMVTVTGTTTITSIVAGETGRRVSLVFTGALTVTDGSNLKLNGNFVTTADDTLTLVSDGVNWYETGRSAN